jgi:hypothetical protein
MFFVSLGVKTHHEFTSSFHGVEKLQFGFPWWNGCDFQ